MITVKKLEWSDNQHGSRCVTDRIYDISIWMEAGKPLYVDSYTTMRRFRIMNEAKAAAQADYDARILSAIEPAPSPRAQALVQVDVYRVLKNYRDDGRIQGESLIDLSREIAALSSQPVADGTERGKFYHKHWDLSKLREARNGGIVDHSGGEAWRYEYTSKDENGEYDMLYRHNVNSSVPAPLPASPGASE